MEGQTKVLWDFMEAAFREGTLDELLLLSKAASDKKYEDQAFVFADLEEAIEEMDDLSAVDDKLELAFSIMPQLTDDEVLQGMKILLSVLTPLVDRMMESAGRDMEAVAEKKDELVDNLRKVVKALAALASIGSKSLIEAQGDESTRKYGRNLGKALNSTANVVNSIHANNSNAVSDFMAGVFEQVDKEEIRKMLDIMAEGFMDQKPPVVRWTASLMAKRARKFLLNK